MVHQVLANAKKVYISVYPELFKLNSGTDARPKQDWWTSVRPRRDDDLSLCIEVQLLTIRTQHPDSSCYESRTAILEDDVINVLICYNRDIGRTFLSVDLVKGCRFLTLIDASHCMPTALCCLSSAKHVWVQRQTFGLKRAKYTLGYRRWIVWCSGQWPALPMTIQARLKPNFVSEIFRFLHVREHIRATPSFHTPVIIVLWCSSNAECPIAATTPSDELPSTEMKMTIVQLLARLALIVPVCICTQNLRYGCGNSRSWDILLWLACLQHQNCCLRIFR